MMRRISQAPRAEHDGLIPTGVHVGRRARGYGMVMIVLASCSVVLLTTILWSLQRPEPHTHESRNPGEFLFPLYRYHRNRSHGAGFLGRRIRSSELQALFGLHGGGRISDDGSAIQDLYIEMEIGDAELYHFHVDTGSGPRSWVYCHDLLRNYASKPLKKWGPNGKFVTEDDSVKCNGRTASVCRMFQKNCKITDCDDAHHFDCLFDVQYLDGTTILGRMIKESITLPMTDKTKRKNSALFGCAYETEGAMVARKVVSDGIIALGNCEGTLLDQLWTGKHISRNVLGVCLVKEMVSTPPVGFISLGMDWEEKFDRSVPNWVKLLQSRVNVYCGFGAKVVQIFVHQKEINDEYLPIAMYIDTGSDMTYLQKHVYDKVLEELDAYAKIKGYRIKADNSNLVGEYERMCWEPPPKKRRSRGRSTRTSSAIDDFGPLTLGFEGMDEAAPIQNLIIQPENYLAWNKDQNELCVNILRDKSNGITNLGSDIMRGNLFVFDVENQRIRWTSSTNCEYT